MADFSFLSDTSDASETAVDDLLSQTRDLCLLEQLSAINCASFPHSDLSADLESRFARLKSLPSAPAGPTPPAASARPLPPDSAPTPLARPRSRAASASRDSPASASAPVSPARPRSSAASARPSPPPRQRARAALSRCEPPGSAPNSEETGGCLFWCPPKKAKPKAKPKRREVDWDSDLGWSKSEELLEDLGSFSIEEQRKILRKAMHEQRKISREARKIVKMAKQASLKTSTVSTPTRPSVSSAELSDD